MNNKLVYVTFPLIQTVCSIDKFSIVIDRWWQEMQF